MRSPNKSLFLIITLLLALTSCASTQLPDTSAHVKTPDAQPQQNSNVVAAIVKAKKANLREIPSVSGAVAGTVSRGDLLSLTGQGPIGAWYQIRDSKTGAEGWIHGNTIALLQTADTSPLSTTSPHEPGATAASVQRARRIAQPISERSIAVSSSSRSASGKSYVNVDGIRVKSPVFSDARPTGASARCRDGSYSFSLNRRGTCSHHGGVAEWY